MSVLPRFSTYSLNSLSLDPSLIKRALPNDVHESNKPPNFEETYDYSTFFYDAISVESGVLLVCPKLFNFAKVAIDSSYYVDGCLARPFIRYYALFDIIILRGKWPRFLKISHALIDQTITLSRPSLDCFQGLNTLLTVNKNNNLVGITDWITYHIHHHGLQGLLLFDNNSDLYTCSDLILALRSQQLERLAIVKAPFPYGPVLRDRRQHLLFLQQAMFFISRLRFLESCRAVASIDIDEMVRPSHQTIFDAAAKSSFGIVRFWGEWRYADTSLNSDYTHADHRFSLPQAKKCPPKLAYVPKRLPLYLTIGVHGLNIANGIARKAVHLLIQDNRFIFWHFYNLSTGWKGSRLNSRTDLVPDPWLGQALYEAGLKPSSEGLRVRSSNLVCQKPLVQVIIPARNRPDLLIRAIQSACSQQSICSEIVVVDDGSVPPLETQLPASILSGIKLIRQDSTRNAAYSRNIGAAAGDSPFLAFLDSDDQWGIYHLHDALKKLEEKQALFVAPLANHRQQISIIKDPMDYLFSGAGDLRTSTFVMARHVFDAVGGFDEHLEKHQDWDLAFRIARHFPLILGDHSNVILDHRAPGRMSSRVDLVSSQRFLERHGSQFSPRQRQVFLSGVVRASLRQSNPQAWQACKTWLADNGGTQQLKKIDQVALHAPAIAHWAFHWKR